MEYLIDLGIDESSLKMMLELNPLIGELEEKDIKEKLILLSNLNCTEKQIRNIIVTNSLIYNRTNESILALIKKLFDFGFTSLNLLFDSNPFILNLDTYEIDKYINQRIKNKESLESIVDDLETNPWLFNEI